MTFHDVLGFWFSSATRPKWFEQSEAFDNEVRRLLMPFHEQAAAGRLADWREHPEGCLASVILLDQVPRNGFRGTPRAFASDPAARELTKLAIERGRAVASSCSYQRLARSTMVCPASRNSRSRSAWVASTEPLPGSERPSASVRQFMLLAVNMPEQEPQVGQADR